MPELPPVAPGEVIDSTTFGNPVVERVVSRYVDETERDAKSPTPSVGEPCYVASSGQLQVWNGSAWVMGGGGTVTGDIEFGDPTVSIGRHSTGRGNLGSNGDIAWYWELVGGESRWIPRDRTGNFYDTYLAYDNNNGFMSLWIDGVRVALWTRTGVVMPNIYTTTTGSPADMNVASDGTLRRSTSSRRYKSNIQPAPELADYVLNPVTFRHDGDEKDFIGFIAEDVAAVDERAAIYDVDADGEPVVENYDLRAVVAVLAAKVNRLEAQLAAT